LIVAAAGAGKTYQIIEESVEAVRAGHKVLVVTYTEANQRELISRFEEKEYERRANFVVKGLYSFLLEDFIRPYQSCFFEDRIDSLFFNQSNPHKRGKYPIPGRQELLSCGSPNPNHYLTKEEGRAHSTFLAKLAKKITDKCQGATVNRLADIYHHIYIDEVQDLIGWDYDVIDTIVKFSDINITCVGDFRQTIYSTANGTKQPKTSAQKLERFTRMKFEDLPLSCSRRSIQSICDCADLIHDNEGYEKTISLVTEIPSEFEDHNGVFAVKRSELDQYLSHYLPTVLRWSISSSGFIRNDRVEKVNFGKSKGLGFDRVLILPTTKYVQYLKKDNTVFNDKDAKTEETKNKLYVAMTRARYSLAFLIDDTDAAKVGFPIWQS